MVKVVIADTTDSRLGSYAYAFECDESTNIIQALKDASNEYIKTKEGQKALEFCEQWLLEDAATRVPNFILNKYGIKRINQMLYSVVDNTSFI